MYYVICPTCEERVEIPANAIGWKRADPWNVVQCDLCDTGFDYDDSEVIAEESTGD
jgi:uncharacterized protein YlaI